MKVKYVVYCKKHIPCYRRQGSTDYTYITSCTWFHWRAKHILTELQKCYPENKYWIERNKK